MENGLSENTCCEKAKEGLLWDHVLSFCSEVLDIYTNNAKKKGINFEIKKNICTYASVSRKYER